MKKLILTLIVAFATVCSFAQDVETSDVDCYEIEGELRTVPDRTVHMSVCGQIPGMVNLC